MHTHIGVLRAIEGFLHIIIVGFFWRTISFSNAGNAFGKAMAYVY